MKNLILLGQFNRNVGLKYQSLLQEEGIEVVIEDWSNSLEVTAGFSLVRLLVPVQDYQRSLKLIDDFEDSASKRLKESGEKAADKETLKTIIGIIISALIVLGVFFGAPQLSRIYNIHTAKMLFKDAKEERKSGNFAQAIKDYTKVIDMFPYSSAAYFDRGLAYNKSENFTFAIADFYKVIEFHPDDNKAYDGLGLSFYHLGNFNKAIEFCTKSIEMNPRDTKAWINRGLVYSKQKNYSQAITDFTQATILDPRDAIAYNNLGYTYAEQGDLPQAFNNINIALQIDPQNKYAYSSRAFAYFEQKDYDKAWEDLHKARPVR